jgi:serine phosphatase RsbU (regulator of sigma subunit)
MHNSGIVIAWSFLGPIGALIFLRKEQAIYWMFQFMLIVGISVLVEPTWSDDALNATDAFRSTFYIMNLCTPTAVVFGASFYFVSNLIKQREANFSLMKITAKKNREITESINYARRIQSAILPSEFELNELPKEIFVLYKPKDIVAGDFYWIKKYENNLFIGVCDCTGHGVPGAMVSVICNGALNRSVEEFGIADPGLVLNKTRELIQKEFENSDEKVQDGMDAAIININENHLSFAGANNPLWLIRAKSKSLEEIKGNKQAVSAGTLAEPFESHKLQIESGDMVYLFTDGISDQFGGPIGRKFGKKALRELLLDVHEKPILQQKQMIEDSIQDWMGTLPQIDDICIVGIRL